VNGHIWAQDKEFYDCGSSPSTVPNELIWERFLSICPAIYGAADNFASNTIDVVVLGSALFARHFGTSRRFIED
jgi:hypothetical protein